MSYYDFFGLRKRGENMGFFDSIAMFEYTRTVTLFFEKTKWQNQVKIQAQA